MDNTFYNGSFDNSSDEESSEEENYMETRYSNMEPKERYERYRNKLFTPKFLILVPVIPKKSKDFFL